MPAFGLLGAHTSIRELPIRREGLGEAHVRDPARAQLSERLSVSAHRQPDQAECKNEHDDRPLIELPVLTPTRQREHAFIHLEVPGEKRRGQGDCGDEEHVAPGAQVCYRRILGRASVLHG
jgi:hypothetical protein